MLARAGSLRYKL